MFFRYLSKRKTRYSPKKLIVAKLAHVGMRIIVLEYESRCAIGRIRPLAHNKEVVNYIENLHLCSSLAGIIIFVLDINTPQ